MADSNNMGSDLDERIIRQVEYYFGDFNLPRDKFLQEQIKLDDGWIPLSTMLNFKRLAALTTDQDRIVDALKKSSIKLIEVDDEQKKIRRSSEKPVPLMTENRQKEIQSRTVYCKGFSKENISLDKLLEYFKPYGPVENVQMRTYLDKASKEYIFKGSVFVVFTTKDLADEFLKKEAVEYDGAPLIIKKQEDYFIDKKKERDDKKRMQKAKLQQVTSKQPSVKKKDDEENESEEEEEGAGSGFSKGAVVHVKGIPSNATWEDIRSSVEAVWKKGAKEGEDKEVDVAYVDFHMGDEEGWVRLAEAGSALLLVQRARQAAMSKGKEVKVEEVKEVKDEEVKGKEVKDEEMKSEEVKAKEVKVEEVKVEEVKVEEVKVEEVNGGGEEKGSVEEEEAKMEVCGGVVEMRVLKGSEEEAYLEKAQGARERKFMSGSKGRGRGRRGGFRKGRGNRGGKRKNTWDNGPSSKKGR